MNYAKPTMGSAFLTAALVEVLISGCRTLPCDGIQCGPGSAKSGTASGSETESGWETVQMERGVGSYDTRWWLSPSSGWEDNKNEVFTGTTMTITIDRTSQLCIEVVINGVVKYPSPGEIDCRSGNHPIYSYIPEVGQHEVTMNYRAGDTLKSSCTSARLAEDYVVKRTDEGNVPTGVEVDLDDAEICRMQTVKSKKSVTFEVRGKK